MKIPILGTGLSGLVGTRVKELLADEFEFADLSLDTGVDITNEEQVKSAISASSSSVILHMAAKTDVDSCEDDKIYGEEGAAWQVNVVGTQNIAQAAKKYNKRLVYISTDFVFEGNKDKNAYSEDDGIDPLNWYGFTKSEGERLVKEADISYTIVRLAYPYRSSFAPKLDFVRRVIDKAHKKEKIFALTDHIFTPTFIDDIAQALRLLLKKELTDIFHVVGSQSLTPQEAIDMILTKFDLKADVTPITRAEYFKNRAFRPFNLSLKNDKIAKLGIQMKRLDDGLNELVKQLDTI